MILGLVVVSQTLSVSRLPASSRGSHRQEPPSISYGQILLGQHVIAQAQVRAALSSAFFAERVTSDYWEYTQWRALQRTFSSMLNVMTTQSMLVAVGVGSPKALPAAAALNWVLKDGIGKLGKLGVAASMGRTFDSDLKRYRFAASLMYTGSSFIELLTPLMPQLFLPLASVSTCGKTVGLSFALSVQPAIHKSFLSGADNLAEITAKAQAQHVVSDNLGLALAVLVVRALERLPWVAALPPRQRAMVPMALYPFITGLELWCTHRELKAVHLRNFNRARAEIAAEYWAERGAAPTFAEVSDREALVLPPAWAVAEGRLPLAFVGPEEFLRRTGVDPRTAVQQGREERYLLQVEGAGRRDSGRAASSTPALLVSLREDATVHDVFQSLLHASYVRREALKTPETGVAQLARMADERRSAARRDSPRFVSSLQKGGWDLGVFLFGGTERVRYAGAI